MITCDDIGNWFAARWNADALLPLLVPGGVHSERAPDEAEPPYGVFVVEQVGPVLANSGFQNYPVFTLEHVVFASEGGDDSSSEIQSRVQFAFPLRNASPNLRNAGEEVGTMRPGGRSSRLAAKLRNAKDVVLNRFVWTLDCTGRMDVQ